MYTGCGFLSDFTCLISESLIDYNITPDEFVMINNVLKEYDDMKG